MYRLIVLLAAIAAVSPRNVDNRIIGGAETSIEKYPYQASVINKFETHDCGACIISNKHVLTAAHCVYQNRYQRHNVKVRAGTSLRKTANGGVVYDLEWVFIHDLFRYTTLDYDVAVLELMKTITFSASAAPISLVPVEEKPKPGEELTVTGWGKTEYGDGKPASVLQEFQVEFIDEKMCEKAYEDVLAKVTPRMFCASGRSQPDKGSYQGDSGGPIVNGRKQLVGIVSWGMPNDVIRYPGIYVDLSEVEVRRFVERFIK